MTPLKWIASRWKGLFDTGAPNAAGGLLAGILQSGQVPRRGSRELIQAYKRLPFVHSAFQKVATDVASVPIRLYRASGGRTAKAWGGRGMIRREMLEDAKLSGQLVEITRHPFLDLVGTFNPALRAHSSRVLTSLYLDLCGEGFYVKENNGMGLPLELWPVPPTWMLDIPTRANPFFRASYLGWQRQFAESDVVWLKHSDPENPYTRGTGLGVALGDELDIDELAGAHVKGWFANRALPSAIVSMDIGQEEMNRFGESWKNDLKGASKAGLVKFVGAKDLKVEVIGDTFKEQQLVELRQLARDTVLQTLNIPPECMGILTNSNRATIDAARTLYAWGVLCPRLDHYVDQLQPLAEEYSEDLVVDYVNPIPDDKEFRRQLQSQLPSAFTVDEHRALAGLPPLPDDEGEQLYGTDTYNESVHSAFASAFTIDEHRELAGLDPLPNGEGEGLFEPMRISEAVTPGEDPTPPLGDDPANPAPADPPANPPKDKPAEDDEDEEEEEDEPTKSPPRRLLHRRKADGGAGLSDEDVSRALSALKPERLSYEVRPVWQARVDAWGNRVLDELGVDVSFDIRNPLVRQHIEHFAGAKMKGVTDTTREALRGTLTEGIALGEGIDDLTDRVSDIFDIADQSRARMIARTEVVGSSNFANVTAFEWSGVVESKEWLTTPVGARDTHKALDGTVVTLLEAFQSESGASAKCPGAFGVPEEDINCRCSVLPVVADPTKAFLYERRGLLFLRRDASSDDRLRVWKRFDKRAANWERVGMAAIRRGFRAQKADVMKVINDAA